MESIEIKQCLMNALINTAFAITSDGVYICDFERVLQSMIEQGVESGVAEKTVTDFEQTSEHYPFVVAHLLTNRLD